MPVADKFVRLEGVDRSEEEQLVIYATLRNWRNLDTDTRAEIRALVADIAGYRDLGRALFEFLTTDMTFQAAVLRYTIPERVLRDARREFYRRWQR